MKRQKIESYIERQLLVAMIMSTEFLSQASAIMNLDLIDLPYFKRIAKWCLSYHQQYGKAPGKNIQSIFSEWEERTANNPAMISEVDSVADLLEGLSNETPNEPMNVPYLIDHLRSYLERKKLQKLQEQLNYSLQTGQEDEAKEAILNWKPIEVQAGNGFDPLRDTGIWERTFSLSSFEPLISFPGDAGKFLNSGLTRDGLIGIQAPEKRGKTFWCIEFVARALMERRKIAFFQVGDLSEHQVMIRLGMYWAQRPFLKHLCGEYEIPISIVPPKKMDEDPEIETKKRTFPNPLTKSACEKACQKLMRGYGLNLNKSYLKVSIHPNSSINVLGISAILDRWELLEGFIPDVIVVDYADILAPEDPRAQPRDQVNTTWKALRKLSQERHCLVIVPTQADAASYDITTQSMKNFSEDKRKLAHVTGMLGLNQTTEEKTKSIMRLNWIALRESPFNSRNCLWVGQCLPIGRAFYCASL